MELPTLTGFRCGAHGVTQNNLLEFPPHRHVVRGVSGDILLHTPSNQATRWAGMRSEKSHHLGAYSTEESLHNAAPFYASVQLPRGCCVGIGEVRYTIFI